MENKKGEIKALFETGQAQAAAVLKRARACAQLTKAWILPPENFTQADDLPLNFQSVGSRGLTNLEGKMLLALFPTTTPWFNLRMSQAIQQDPKVSDDQKGALEQLLFLREVSMLAQLETSDTSGGYQPNNFRSSKRAVLSQILCTGDALEQLTDEYQIKLFKRDQYTTKRSSDGRVMYHTVKEQVDSLDLSDEELTKAGLKPDEVKAEATDKRMRDLYTRVAWQPREKNWKIEQEFEGVIIRTSTERISPFFCTAYERMSGDDYGRGIVETNLGDLNGLDNLESKLLDLMGLAAKALFVNDPGSGIRDKDLQKPSGSIVQGFVGPDGRAKGVGVVSFNMTREFQILDTGINRKTTNLSKAFLMESELQPQKERVTREQILRIAQELEGALGGVYAPISEEQQIPLLMRLEFQMTRDKLMPPLPDGVAKVQTVTGIEALGRAQKSQTLMAFIQAIATLGPEAMARVNVNTLVDIMSRYYGVQEPGLFKSDEQVAQEKQQAMQQAVQAAAAQKTVDVVGNVAEHKMTQPPQGIPQ